MPFKLSFRQVITRLIILFLCSVLFGVIVGHVMLAILLTALALLTYHYKQLFVLYNWLWKTKSISPPESEGVWGRVFDGLDRLVKTHRRKQKSLNERVRQYRDGAEAIPDAGVVLGKDLTIQWSNKRAVRLLGILWPKDKGQRIDNLLRAPEFSLYLKEANFELPCILSSPVNGLVKLELRFMDYGQDSILLLARDVSKIQRVEEMRRDFVANVSHELKTPLTVVRGYVEMIQASEQEFEPHWQQAFSVIEGQVTRMDRLVEQLLVLSRVEVNTEHESKELLHIPNLLQQLLKDSHWLNQEKQHSIVSEIDLSLGVLGIETELKSAFANLISNAIAYTADKGKITVIWKKDGDKAIFTVKDNGIGIRPEELSRLTERFYRVDKSRSRDTGGAGLGLAIVKHVLYHHNAELVIESQWQQGSTFSIIFDESVVIPIEINT